MLCWCIRSLPHLRGHMRSRPLSAFAALLAANIAPVAVAQESPAAPAPAAPVYGCDAQASLALAQFSPGSDSVFAWNCQGRGGVSLQGVPRSAMISRGLMPNAIAAVQIAVATADGRGMCLAIGNIMRPQPSASGEGVDIQMLSGFTYVTHDEMAGAGARLAPTIVSDVARLPAGAASCSAGLGDTLTVVADGVVRRLFARPAPQRREQQLTVEQTI